MVKLAIVAGLFGFGLWACAATDTVARSSTGGAAGVATDSGSGGASGGAYAGGAGGRVSVDAGSGGEPGDPCDPNNPMPSYVGCDFWPTVTSNGVWDVFDFAVVVANAGDDPTTVTVDKDGSLVASEEVPPRGLAKIHLPWVSELKWEQGNTCGTLASVTSSVHAVGGAYHVKSDKPISVYQFNPLEYEGKGGPAGKSWDSCPGLQPCFTNDNQPIGCYAFTSDASLLLPSTAWTGNYRVTAPKNYKSGNFLAITAHADATHVEVKLAPTANVLGDASVPSAANGGFLAIDLAAGDVVQLVGDVGSDFSGSLVSSNHPIQLISGVRCQEEPAGTPACDHLEETVLPAETLGSHYLVTAPTAVKGNVVGHHVRIYGNVDDTELTYAGAAPAGAPAKIDAGQVLDFENVLGDFEITGTQPFAVASLMLGGAIQDPATSPTDDDYSGDPSQSIMVPVEQFRKRYVFLAPDDFDVSYVDVVAPSGTQLTLDGAPVSTAPKVIAGGWDVVRVKLGTGVDGAHLLEASAAVGIQVMGYGSFTSYQFPGGSDLTKIAPPPVK